MTPNFSAHRKVILAVVGLPGAGKTTTTRYLAEKNKKNLTIVHFGRIVNDYIDEHKLKHTKKTHQKIWLSLREKYGQEAFAILNEKKIKKSLEKGSVLIDGLRSWEEYLYLKKKFPHTKIHIITVYSDKEIRHQRSANRRYRKNLYGDDRDIAELVLMHMGPTIAFCDYLVVNNGPLKKLYKSLDETYKKIIDS